MTPPSRIIPQPRPLPIIGNLPEIDAGAPAQSIMRLVRIHGPIFRLSLAGRTITFLSSQELVNEACDESRFGKKLSRPLLMLRDLVGDGLFTAETTKPNWQKAHGLLMPAFGPLGVRGMFNKMRDIAEQMMVRWERFGESAVIDVAVLYDRPFHSDIGLST
jgi:cytochrome P450/NADPH-cytochrome P450 reductase